ncbi:MAG: putative glutamine amidotransferase [Gaiellales bacterium]|nr:putative glutamine amidotransferase [Gaiellales bacterium]
MSRRPRIGLTLELHDPIVAKVDERMREVIEGAGGLVVVIPHSADPDSWQAAYDVVDAVVMMGGPDVAAEAYGAAAHPLTKPGHAGFDTTELGLARACLRDGKPVLGICRGNQVLNVAAGGTLVQDVPSSGTELVHMGDWVRVVDDPPSCIHEIEVLAGTRLAGWLGAGRHVVNSYHHQAVERLGDGLRTAAVAPDGTIEAVESSNGAFALGLQWHNEFHMRADERYARPLQALVAAARA